MMHKQKLEGRRCIQVTDHYKLEIIIIYSAWYCYSST